MFTRFLNIHLFNLISETVYPVELKRITFQCNIAEEWWWCRPTWQSSLRGQIAPVIEWTVSNATILGTFLSTLARSSAKWTGSLWRNICLGTRLLRIPWIMDAWLPSSENMWHPENKFNKCLFLTERKMNKLLSLEHLIFLLPASLLYFGFERTNDYTYNLRLGSIEVSFFLHVSGVTG